MLDQIRRRLLEKDFIPFIIRTTDGREFHVHTRDHAWAPTASGRVYVSNDDGTEDMIAGLHIASVRHAATPADTAAS